MRRRIIRKNKKRRDPRYFLHEDLGTPGDEPATPNPNPAPLQTGAEQTAKSAQQQAANQDDKPETVTVANLTGDQEKKGAHLMLTFVNDLITRMATFTVNDLKQELETAGYAPEPEEGGTQTAATTSPVEAPSATGGLV